MLLVFVFISLLCECLAWWGHGHLLVAEIAVAHLNKTAPDVLDVAFKMVAEYQDFFPKTKNFVPSAAWSDNLHSQDFRLLAEWHYNDRPWQVDENLPPLPPANPSNMIWALESCIKGISSPKLTPWAASFYIRWINHLIGDLHQPLHNIAQYSSNFPDGQGDRGGNECKLSPIAGLSSQIKDLHKLWDSAGGTFVQDPFYPPTGPGFTPELQLKFANQTRELMKKYPFESFEMNRFDPIDVDQWSLEGFNLAIKYAYISDSQTSPPLLKCLKSTKLTFPIENLKAVQDITHQQIALAGYRLATVLKSSLPKTWVVPISSSTDDASQMKEIKDLLTELREAQTKLLQQQSNSTTTQSTKTVSPATVVICLLAGVVIGAAAACGYVWWRRRSLTNYRVLNDEQELGNMVTVS